MVFGDSDEVRRLLYRVFGESCVVKKRFASYSRHD